MTRKQIKIERTYLLDNKFAITINKNKLTSVATMHRPALFLGSMYRHYTDSTQTTNLSGQNVEWLIHNLSIYLHL